MASTNPAVVDGLEVNETRDGLVVYDSRRNRVHYLNATAAAIFNLCDGVRDERGIADAVGRAYDLGQAPVGDVAGCLNQLRDEGLLR